MTCIIGLYYKHGKGAVLMADSRTMLGGDFSRGRKLFVVGDDVVFAAAGYSGIAEKLVPNVQAARYRSRKFMATEVVNIFEDEMAELYNRYKMTRPFRFATDDALLSALVGFLDGDTPKLHCLHENGYAEALHDFRAIGHGARHAHNILSALYDPSLSRERAPEIGIHALVQVSKVDAMVDGCPQVALLEKSVSDAGIKILNCAAGDEFAFDCDEIEKVKKKLEGIEEKRTQVFHLLLDGSSEIRHKLDETLKEYRDGKHDSNHAKAPGKHGGEGAPPG